MRLLLDTHIAIWSIAMSQRIKAHVRALLSDPANTIVVSAVSIWEIAIKHPLGKSTAPPFTADVAIRHFTNAGYELLDITPDHAAAVAALPRLHGDPFDRLLLAQAMVEPMRLMTADPLLYAYNSTIIRC